MCPEPSLLAGVLSLPPPSAGRFTFSDREIDGSTRASFTAADYCCGPTEYAELGDLVGKIDVISRKRNYPVSKQLAHVPADTVSS